MRFVLNWKENDRSDIFLLIMNKTEFRLIHNKNCQYHQIVIKLKWNEKSGSLHRSMDLINCDIGIIRAITSIPPRNVVNNRGMSIYLRNGMAEISEVCRYTHRNGGWDRGNQSHQNYSLFIMLYYSHAFHVILNIYYNHHWWGWKYQIPLYTWKITQKI